MGKSNFRDAKAKRDGATFVPVPHVVLNAVAYIGLSAHARMLLFDIAAQYRGSNNGDFSVAWKQMKMRGWKSEATLSRAKKELLNAGLIAETRKGQFPKKCALYGVTWFSLDPCEGKLDISPAGFPRGAYRLKDPAPHIGKNAALNTRRVAKDKQ